MKKTKLIIIVVIIILLILAVYLFINLQKSKKEKEYAETRDDNMQVDIEENIIPVRGEEEFASIEKLVNNFYLYLRMGNTNAVDQIITSNFKTSNGGSGLSSTNTSLSAVVKRVAGSGEEYYAREIYYKDDLGNPIYLVYGMIETNHQGQESYLLVYLDKQTSAYAIEPINKSDYERYVKEEKQLKVIGTIEQKEFNKYKNQINSFNDEELARRYLERYLKESLYHTQYAYHVLDEEYKTKKFGSMENYQKYVTNRKNMLESMLPDSMKSEEDFANEDDFVNYLANYESKGLKSYKKEMYQDYTQYVLLDDYQNYYIIKVTSPMKYTIVLDSYTVDLPDFINNYQNQDVQGRMQLNLVRLFNAINDGDYHYAYTKLNQTFRETNFKTEAQFEEYMKANFYPKNSVGVSNFQVFDYIYRIDVTIRNQEQPNATYSVRKTFSMSLGEGTDFEYSFNLE